jgi:hypothetical protein
MAALLEKWCGSGDDCDFKTAASCLTVAIEIYPEWFNKLIPRKVTSGIRNLAIEFESSLQLDMILDQFPQIFGAIHALKKHLPKQWKLEDDGPR